MPPGASAGARPTPKRRPRRRSTSSARSSPATSAAGKHMTRRHAVSPRAERLPAHRARQVDLPELRRRQRVRRHLQPALRRHEPGQGRRRVRRFDHRHVRWLGFDWADRLYYASDYFEQIYQYTRRPDPRRQGLRRTADGRGDPRLPRDAHRAGPREPVARPPGRGEPRRCSSGCGRASSRTARRCCARRSTWRRRTSTCATRSSTASGTPPTTAPATRGASTRCTTTRTPSPTRSSASRTRSARSSSRTTARCTTGSSTTCRCRASRGRSSSRA